MSDLETDSFLLRAQLAQSHKNEDRQTALIARLRRENEALRAQIRAMRQDVPTEVIQK